MKKILLRLLKEVAILLVGFFLVSVVMGAALYALQPWVAYILSFICVYSVGFTTVNLVRNFSEKAYKRSH